MPFNPTRPSEVRALLDQTGFKPSRILGQNFLIDANILNLLVEAAELSSADSVVEIGPGLGVVTGELMAKAGRVVAVEKDKRLHEWLAKRFSDAVNLDLRLADALDLNWPQLRAGGVTKLVSNLPYSVGTRVLVDTFRMPDPLALEIVTVQKEVGDRLAAKPDTEHYGALSIWAQAVYDVKILKVISPTCFFPAPDVRSAIVKMALRKGQSPIANHQLFFTTVKRCFEKRRKQLGTILNDNAWISRAGIDPKARPETLAVSDWIRLSNVATRENSNNEARMTNE